MEPEVAPVKTLLLGLQNWPSVWGLPLELEDWMYWSLQSFLSSTSNPDYCHFGIL